MVLENSVAYPTDKTLPFPIKGELVLDLDKNNSGHKAAARFLVDLDVNSDDKQTAVAEFGFSHPKIGKVGKYDKTKVSFSFVSVFVNTKLFAKTVNILAPNKNTCETKQCEIYCIYFNFILGGPHQNLRSRHPSQREHH